MSEPTAETDAVEPIAIVGMAARVPGAGDIRAFWANLVDGVESITFFDRAEQAARGVPDSVLDDPSFVPAAPVLDDMDGFDAGVFGMARREADLCDPQQRLFLELARTALDDAGCDPTRFDGAVGVYGGKGSEDYLWRHLRASQRVMNSAGHGSISMGNLPDYLATWTSYKLNLSGPSMTVQTACSTGLVAVHLACEALRSGECDLALAGGVCIEFPHGQGYLYYEGGVSSSDGHCRPFDAAADGTMWGSGGGVVVLKPLATAIEDGDHIRAVIRGDAVNNDGAAKVGFTAPSVSGQSQVIAQALAAADVSTMDISYVEAHGTGTALGDPIELTALTQAFGADGSESRGRCGVGSVKSNIGHLSQGAGVVGLIKTALALENGVLPPTLNYRTPNPGADLTDSPFYVVDSLTRWERNGQPRRAGVSSFGFGGTNAYVVVEEAPVAAVDAPADAPALLLLSARTPTARDAAVSALSRHLATEPGLALADVAHTLRAGRSRFEQRAAVVAADTADAAAALSDRKRLLTGSAESPPRLAFLFSGQGAQYAGMGAGLYDAEPVYRAAVDECAAVLRPEPELDLHTLLAAGGDDEQLRRTEYAQPALFAVEYALAALWRSWGVTPAAMIGHSIGEYVAATLAGVFTLPDALRLVALRGRLMQALPAGAMLSIQADESDVDGLLPAEVSVAAVNGPDTCVASGPFEAIEALEATLAERKIRSKRLRTSHAFHSPMMEPILAEFEAAVAAVPRREPSVPMFSDVSGDWLGAEATDPAYWARHLREPVRFGACVGKLVDEGGWAFIECGPGRQLAGLARMQTSGDGPAPQPSLPDPGKGGDRQTVLAAAGRLWCAGVEVEPPDDPRARIVSLPGYPYERVRHWIEPDPADATVAPAAPVAPSGRRPLDDWFAVPSWAQAPPTAPTPWSRCLLLAGDRDRERLADALRTAGVDVVVGPTDYDQLTDVPEHVVYATALAGDEDARERGFFDLLDLVRALARVETPVQLDVLTRAAADVTGSDLLRPEYATVAGIARVVPVELPSVRVRLIDGDTADPAPYVAELLGVDRRDEVALRGRRRWVQHYDEVRLPDGGPDAGLRTGGVYLITGGLGGIGGTLAEDFADRAAARVVLVGRTTFPPREEWDAYAASHDDRVSRAIATIGRIEKAGGEAVVLSADVTDVEELRAARAEILGRYGRIDGIVHAAGLPGGGMVEVKQRADAEAVLAAKVTGTLALREAFGDLPMDFVALCSSVTAVIGGIGQVDYCAANAFLDAHARSSHGWAARVVSIDWGAWRDVGMAAEVAVPDALQALRAHAEQAAGDTEPVEHELLTGRVTVDGQLLPSYRAALSPRRNWVLAEHHIAGVPVLPGVALLEMTRAALTDAQPAPSDRARVELRDVEFALPLAVADDGTATARVDLVTEPDEITFTVSSGDHEHAQGSVGWIDPAPPSTVDLAVIRSRCTARDDLVTEFTDRLRRSEGAVLQLGPRWDGLREIHAGEREELARLELPEVAADELRRWVLHPALFDLATAYGSVGGQHAHLPHGYGRCLVRDALPATVWSHIRYHADSPVGGDVISADVTITDDTGRPLVEITDFTLRRIRGDLDSSLARLSEPAAAETAPLTARPGAMTPSEGAEAFRRLLATDIGPQVVVTPMPLAEIIEQTRRVTVEQAESDEDTAPETADADASIEGTLTRIWSEVLGVDAVEPDDDFFELGGNSLIAIQLVARVRKAVGVKLPMRILFEKPTVAGMAASVRDSGDDAATAGPAPAAAEPAGSAPTIQRLPRRGQ